MNQDFKLTIKVEFLDLGTINNGPKDAQNHWRQVIRVFNKNYAPISTSEAPIIEVKLTIELGFLDSGTINNGPKDAQNH